MEDYLIESERLPLERKSLIPGEGFFVPDSFDEDLSDERARTALDGADVAVVADTDADGLACVALIRAALDAPTPVDPVEVVDGEDPEIDAADALAGEDPIPENDAEPDETDPATTVREKTTVALVPAGPHDLDEGLERVAAFGREGIDVFVCDLCPDSYEFVGEDLEAVVEMAGEVRWFDHHQWKPEVAERIRSLGVNLVVGESDEECTADVALRSMEFEYPDHLVELARVTRDHDLWIKEDPRSDDLSDYAHWTDNETYVETVRRYGPDLPEEIDAYLADRREEKQALIEKAVARAELKEIGPWTVGVTYGRCSQNEVAEGLREQGADAAVIVKPAGSASIRGTEGFERAHEVARQVNGGGHPRAAGCKPDVYDDMLDYAHHWTTRGAVTKQVILDAFREIAPEEDEETDE